jgi:hypothetical protein
MFYKRRRKEEKSTNVVQINKSTTNFYIRALDIRKNKKNFNCIVLVIYKARKPPIPFHQQARPVLAVC